MKWKKYTIETTTAAEDFMSSMLMDLGIEGIEIEDNIPLTKEDQADMFIDFLPELPPDEGISHVSFYVEEDGSDQTEILKQVKIGLEKLRDMVEVGSGVITSSETEDLDWINNWKKYFTSFTIDDILIKPTWEELKEEDKDKFLIEIDPGISFGTGKHETTQLCIRQLQKYVEGKHPKVLDVGCGSGILSIVALKLGAREVVGTDLDADCMTSTRDNMQVNHLDLSLGTFYVGNLIDDEELQEKVGTEEYEIVVANILAPVIIAMAPVIPARLKQGGYFITSGIIDFKENEVKEAIEAAGLTVVEINHQGEWVNITAQKQKEQGMYQFFVEDEQVQQDRICIVGGDVNHIGHVLRMKTGEKIRISDQSGRSYFCRILEITEEEVWAQIEDTDEMGTEFSHKVYLFQGLPKSDKMELIIQKTVELGVYTVIPVAMKNCVVKLDEKKAQSKCKRWQAIAESAAKQSKRTVIPQIQMPLSWKQALEEAKELDVVLVPYENERGMEATREIFRSIPEGASIGVMIGPEGGFSPEEIAQLDKDMHRISLGRRILRTETAGMATLSMLIYELDI